MAIRNWTGLGGDDLISTAGNWDVAPIAGDSLVFSGVAGNVDWDLSTSYLDLTIDDTAVLVVTQNTIARFTGTVSVDNTTSGSTWNFTLFNGDVECGGFSDIGGMFQWAAAPSSPKLVVNGAGNNSLYSDATLIDLLIVKTSGTLIIAGSILTTTFSMSTSIGNTQTIDLQADVTTTNFQSSGLGTSILGNAVTPRDINLTNQGSFNVACDVQNVTVVGPLLRFDIASCTDLGGNTNVFFGVPPKNVTWTGAGVGDLASTAGNWDLGVPLAGDTIVFDDFVGGNCTWDLTATFNSVAAGVFGPLQITLVTDLNLSGTFDMGAFGGAQWFTNGFDIYCSGISSSTTNLITWAVGSTLYIIGSGISTVDLGAALQDVTFRKSGGTGLFNNPPTINGTLTLDSTLGNFTFNPTNPPAAPNKITTIGAAPFKTTVGGAFGPYALTVTDANVLNQYSDWQNVTITGGPIYCDPATCTDLGGNVGIIFGLPPLVTNSVRTQTLNFTSLISASPESLGEKINDALQSITDGGRDKIEIQDIDIFVRQQSSRSSGVYNVNIVYRTPGNSEYFARGMSVPSHIIKPTIGATLDEFAWLNAAGMISDEEQAIPIRIKQINTRFTHQITYHQLLVLWKKQDAWTDTSDSSRRLMVVVADANILAGDLGSCSYKASAVLSADKKMVRNVSNITLPAGGAAWCYMDIETMELVCIPSCCN